MIPLNVQPRERQDRQTDGSLEVVKVFHTVQGEGPLAGTSAVFVRLAGCNLMCDGSDGINCDTDYTTGRERYQVDDLVYRVKGTILPDCAKPLVVLTGGEPFRQNLAELVRTLMGEGFKVQIESNGTLHLNDFPWGALGTNLTVVVSPKSAKLARQFEDPAGFYVSAYKYVLRAGRVDKDTGLPVGLFHPDRLSRVPVYVQPEDQGDVELNRLNENACVRSTMKYGYRVSLQMHKHLRLD